jgi:hypothetical protein
MGNIFSIFSGNSNAGIGLPPPIQAFFPNLLDGFVRFMLYNNIYLEGDRRPQGFAAE